MYSENDYSVKSLIQGEFTYRFENSNSCNGFGLCHLHSEYQYYLIPSYISTVLYLKRSKSKSESLK